MKSDLSSTGLPQKTIDKIQHVFSKFPAVKKVILYGSRAKGNYHTGSDIDLTIKSSTLTAQQLLTIENELDDLLLPYKIDLSLFDHIENENLIKHIKRVGILFYQGGESK